MAEVKMLLSRYIDLVLSSKNVAEQLLMYRCRGNVHQGETIPTMYVAQVALTPLAQTFP